MIITPNWTVVAVDFDGTIARTDYPTIIGPIKENIAFVKHLAELGAVLVLWTCREGKLLEDAVNFCESQDLHFPYVNENPPFRVEKFGTNPRKIGADYYIDDKNVMPPIVNVGENVLKNKTHSVKRAETWKNSIS